MGGLLKTKSKLTEYEKNVLFYDVHDVCLCRLCPGHAEG